MMSRAGMFRVSKGVAVDMKDRVYELPSFYSKIHLFSILNTILCSFLLSLSHFVIYVFQCFAIAFLHTEVLMFMIHVGLL